MSGDAPVPDEAAPMTPSTGEGGPDETLVPILRAPRPWPEPLADSRATRLAELALVESRRAAQIRESHAPATLPAYEKNCQAFEAWCTRMGEVKLAVRALPASDDTLSLYVLYVGALDERSPTTVRRAIAAIRMMHERARAPARGRGVRRAAGVPSLREPRYTASERPERRPRGQACRVTGEDRRRLLLTQPPPGSRDLRVRRQGARRAHPHASSPPLARHDARVRRREPGARRAPRLNLVGGGASPAIITATGDRPDASATEQWETPADALPSSDK